MTEIVLPDPDGEPLGWLVAPYDVAGLAEAISEVLEQPATARRRATAAWHSARDRFSIKETSATVAGVWREAAGRRRPFASVVPSGKTGRRARK